MDKTYCYGPDYTVLKNKHGIRDDEALQQAEALITRQRMRQPIDDAFEMTARSYQNLHNHIFQDVYERAGEYRSTELWKGMSGFEHPHEIAPRMEQMFGENAQLPTASFDNSHEFAREAAKLMHGLNDIHAFREGNGRTQRLFLERLAMQSGFRIDEVNIDRKLWMEGSIQSFAQGAKSDHPVMTQCITTAIDLSRPVDIGPEFDHGHDGDGHGHSNDGHDGGRGGR
ncbi:MAG: Fic/DOC family protein [Candidatus Phaeomarinobacter sp.]